MVRPGFYAALRRGAESDPAIQAAFCRVITIDERNGWIELSEREHDTAAVLPNLIERLGVCNTIMFPSMVVRRSAYERLGGFHPGLFHAADWDMWKRIAASFPVWYDPEPLALYRVHGGSDTSRLMQTGANIKDARRAIEIAEAYLPPARARALSRKARLYHAQYAMEVARERLLRGLGIRHGPGTRWTQLLGLAAGVGGAYSPHASPYRGGAGVVIVAWPA